MAKSIANICQLELEVQPHQIAATEQLAEQFGLLAYQTKPAKTALAGGMRPDKPARIICIGNIEQVMQMQQVIITARSTTEQQQQSTAR